eukprot:12259060-Heterocapsa_arctica.AAC.1
MSQAVLHLILLTIGLPSPREPSSDSSGARSRHPQRNVGISHRRYATREIPSFSKQVNGVKPVATQR